MEFVNGEIERIHDEFLIRWKDYAWLRSQLKEAERHDRIMQKIKFLISKYFQSTIDGKAVYVYEGDYNIYEEINKIDQEEDE
jgi:hypothetical protein